MLKLSTSEISKKIQPRICKITNSNGEGTGYIYDTKEGMLLSSFHLAGQMYGEVFCKIDLNDNLDELGWKLKRLCILETFGYLLKTGLEFLISNQTFNKSVFKATINKTLNDKKNIEKIIEIANSHYRKRLQELVDTLKEFLKRSQEYISKTIFQSLKKDPIIKEKIEVINDLQGLFVLLKQLDYLGAIKIELSDENIVLRPKELITKEDDFEIFFKELISASEKILTADKKITNDDLKSIITDKELESIEQEFWEKRLGKTPLLDQDHKNILIEAQGRIFFGEVYIPPKISFEDKRSYLKNYALYDSVPIQIKTLEDGSDYLLSYEKLNIEDDIEPLAKDEKIELGEKIYFAGYPLTQNNYTFGKGMLASTDTSQERNSLIIDGNFSVGHSGGPCFMQKEGKIYWVGQISSQLAKLEEDYLVNIEKLKQSKDAISIGNVGIIDALVQTSEAMVANLTTGKGRIIRFNLEQLLNLKKELVIDPYLDIWIKRKRLSTLAPGLKFFQYINQYTNCSVEIKHIKEYVNNCLDKSSREFINQVIGNTDLSKCSVTFRQKLDQDQKYDSNHMTLRGINQVIFKSVFNLTVLASKGKIIGGLKNYGNAEHVVQNCFLTNKFIRDHIVGNSRKDTEQKAKIISAARNVSKSSVIGQQDIEFITEEVKKTQKHYKDSHERAHQIGIQKAKLIRSVFFKSEPKYQITTFSENNNEPEIKKNCAFFYSVRPFSGTYYMHHFETTAMNNKEEQEKKEKAAGWENDKVNGKSFYYTFN